MGKKGKYLWPPLNWHPWRHWEWNEAYTESSGSPSGFPFPGWARTWFPSQQLLCALKGKTANQLRYEWWSPCELCTALKFHFLPLLSDTSSASAAVPTSGERGDWRGQHNEETFLAVVGTWCSFKRKHCESFVFSQRVWGRLCRETNLSCWVQGKWGWPCR